MDSWGRVWLRVTPRSARSWATVFEVIELPRSAWRVSWSVLDAVGRGWHRR